MEYTLAAVFIAICLSFFMVGVGIGIVIGRKYRGR